MIFEVTQKHIEDGRRCRGLSDRCPVALSMQTKFKYAWVGNKWIGLGSGVCAYKQSANLRAKINQFDETGEMEPFKFRLDKDTGKAVLV